MKYTPLAAGRPKLFEVMADVRETDYKAFEMSSLTPSRSAS